MKLNLGCGDLILPGYVNIDLYDTRAPVKDDLRALKYEDGTVDEILSSHVIEHFDYMEAFVILKEWHRVLKVGGILDIETPNMLGLCKKFLELDEYGRYSLYGNFFSTPWLDGMWHKFLYTPTQLSWTLSHMGFINIKIVPASRYPGQEDINLRMNCQKQ